MERMVEISKEDLVLTLCLPDFENGYYRGTRFDHSGVFRKVVHNDYLIADEWFEEYGPYKHDAVCGYSEEFAESGYDAAAVGGVFLKPGVGLLVKGDNQPYDHFRLYEVADSGKWTVENTQTQIVFKHEVEGDGWGYEYVKVVSILDRNTFEIRHIL